MKITIAEHSGFCFGVEKAVELSIKAATDYKDKGLPIFSLGEIIHNEIIIDKLNSLGVKIANSTTEIPDNSVVIVRSHGVAKNIILDLSKKNCIIIDATCPFVKKIQLLVEQKHNDCYQIIILGVESHPEVIGINGWCENSATIVSKSFVNLEKQLSKSVDKICVVAQTTHDIIDYDKKIKKIAKIFPNLVEYNNTICYTTVKRQSEAKILSSSHDCMLVVGSEKSSNTKKLFDICKSNCPNTYFISKANDVLDKKINLPCRIAIVAGASTPKELITEVKNLMAQKFENEIKNAEFLEAIAESQVNLREGTRVKGIIISADEKGVSVNISTKKDGYIPAEEAGLGEYNPDDFPAGAEIETVVVTTRSDESGCIILSRKTIELAKEGDRVVDAIREGGIFEVKIQSETSGGLLSKLGSYTIFVPSSQVAETYVKDIKKYVGKPMRLVALEVDDKKRKIVASAKSLLVLEKKEREEVFWTSIVPDVIVTGKVKRATNFGAFVSVGGFDCLVHITDISWGKIKSAEEVLKIGKEYDFLVLTVDKERGRVSLSYKALQPHPFEVFTEKYPIGTITKGKVSSVVPFGAFVEIADGIEGLVHVSEASHTFINSVSEVAKVGEEVDVYIKDIDTQSRKVTLSIKACTPEPEPTVEEIAAKEKKAKVKSEKQAAAKARKTEKTEGTGVEHKEEASNNPLASLLKGIDVE